MHVSSRLSWHVSTVVLALAALLVCGVAPSAIAGPAQPTLSADQLDAALAEAGGELPAHFKTVLKGGNEQIVDIDARVTAVTGGFAYGDPDLASLILFDSDDPRIEHIGGIAAGMSGSPLYVEIMGTDYLVGAVSYGDAFTLRGQGLATPVEAMIDIERYEPPAVGIRAFGTPVLTQEGLKDRVILAPKVSPQLEDAAADGAIVATPLSTISVAGLDTGSAMYKALAANMAEAGLTVKAGGLLSRESSYTAAFEPGSAMAVMAARNDLWVGSVGTVTYTDGSRVVGFGHPVSLEGPTNLFLCNAWIDGVWNNLDDPYKLARPAGLRGALTQDRSAGVMGTDGTPVSTTKVTGRCTDVDTGEVATSTVDIPRHVMNVPSVEYEGLGVVAAYIAGSRLVDQSSFPGSAVVTTTVVVGDGEQTWEIVRSSIVDDERDVTVGIMWDADDIVSSLQWVAGNGIAHPDIISIDVTSEISSDRRLTEVVDIRPASGALRTGENTLTVGLFKWGIEPTQTVDVTITIPAGVPLTGALSAGSVFDEDDYYFLAEEVFVDDEGFPDFGIMDRTTVADMVGYLSEQGEAADRLTVSFTPQMYRSQLKPPTAIKRYPAITTSTTVPGAYLVGGESTSISQFVLAPKATTIAYGSRAAVVGELIGPDYGATVEITGLAEGESTPTVYPSVELEMFESLFSAVLGPLKKTTTFTFSYDGGFDALPTTKTLKVYVQATNSLKASSTSVSKGRTVTLTSTISQPGASGKVYFERWSASKRAWVAAGSGATKTLAAGAGKVTYSVKPSTTSTYRTRFVAGSGSTNASKTSSSVTVRVR